MRPDHPDKVVFPFRGLLVDIHQVAPTSSGSVCNEVQQQIASICVTGSRPPSLGSGCTQRALGRSRPLWFPTGSHLGQSGGDVARVPMQENHSEYSRGSPNMPWFWNLVTILSQILVCLPNLLTQPFSQIPHRNLQNLNLHAWLLEPLLSRSRGSLRRWQHELRLLKGSQPDQSMKIYLFVYLGFYVAFNTVQVISRRVVGRAEETSTYSWSRFCTVNCRPTASNYQLSHLRLCREPNRRLRGGRRECYHSAIMVPSL